MQNESIIVTGATGNLGSKVAAALIEKHQRVIVTGRSLEKLAAFEGKAEILAGDLEDANFLKMLLAKGSSVFLVLPSLKELSLRDFAMQFISLAESSGIQHVVNISNCTLTRWGRPTALIEFESYLKEASSVHIKHLRCANFFENLNWGIHTPYRPAIRLPYISSYEIAETAARYLIDRDFTGSSVEELMGVGDYSMSEIAGQLGITYKQIPARPEDRPFFDAFNSGQYELVKRTPANTSQSQDERFTLTYFLKHHLDHAVLKSE